METGWVATFFSGIILGILLRSFFSPGFFFPLLLSLLGIIIFLATRGRALLAALFVFSLALGMWRFDYVEDRSGLDILARSSGQMITVEGTIVEEPKEKDSTTLVVVETEVADGIVSRILVITRPYVKYLYGDRIKIFGRLEKIENFSGDFDYVAYMAKDEIYYQFLNPKITLISGGWTSDIQRGLFDFKNLFLGNINSVMREPEASLSGGIILGAKSSLDKKLLDDFKRAGVIHIVALSGYNVTIVSDYLMNSIWFLPGAIRLIVGSLAIILFAMMTGGGSTVVRASIMTLLALLAKATGRMYLAGMSLLVAGAIMVVLSPKILVFDISFQLSFLATAGLILLSPVLEKKLYFITEKLKLREMLATTLSAQIAVSPLILYKMGSLSWVSVPANLIIGPIVPVAMYFSFLTGFAGFISYSLSSVFSLMAFLPLFSIIKIAKLFAVLSV